MSSGYFMQPQQARQVKWIDGNRTIGEMLDDGSMTLSMLVKGQESENPNIKAACSILKVEQENQIKAYIASGKMPRNLDEARAVVWPYDKWTQRPGWTIGQLLDNHEIGQQNFSYALYQHWNDQVYQASAIILSDLLNIERKKIISGNGPLLVEQKRTSFMSKEGEAATYKYGFWMGMTWAFWTVLVLADIGYIVYQIIEKNLIDGLLSLNWFSWLIVILGVAFGSILCVKIINRMVFRRIDTIELDIRKHKAGQIGEDKVADELRKNLDGACHLFRNYHINGKKQDVDQILLSPWGVFAIEIKNPSGNSVFELCGEEFKKRIGNKYVQEKDKRNPIKQVRGNARDLKCFLESILSEHACPAYVTPILIWANSDVTSYDKDCVIDVWKINELPRKIDELKQRPQKISDKCYKEIEKKLMKFYEE